MTPRPDGDGRQRLGIKFFALSMSKESQVLAVLVREAGANRGIWTRGEQQHPARLVGMGMAKPRAAWSCAKAEPSLVGLSGGSALRCPTPLPARMGFVLCPGTSSSFADRRFPSLT